MKYLPKGWKARKLKSKRNPIYGYFLLIILFSLIMALLAFDAKAIDTEGSLDSQESRQAEVIQSDVLASDPCGLKDVLCTHEELSAILPSQQAVGTITEVSAYTSHVNQTDETPCIPAANFNFCDIGPEEYGVDYFVASNAYPLYTKLKIEHLGTAIVVDRMNQRYSNRIDVYMGYDLERALNFGVQNLYVTVN